MKYLLIFTFFIGFNACTHLYYMPDIRTVPIHSDEGDITLNANTGYGGAIAYSYTDNIFSNIAVSHFESKNFIDKNLPFEDKSSFTRYDLGVGYNFTPKNNFLIQVFGGFNLGKQSHQYSDSVLVNLNITTTQPYLQLDLGFKSNIYDIVLSNRISYLNFSNFTIPTRLIESSEFTKFNQLQLLQQLNSLLLYEPAIITRLGYKNIKFVSSLSYISNVEIFKAQTGISTSPPVSRLMLTVGLSVNFNIIDEFGDKPKSKYKK